MLTLIEEYLLGWFTDLTEAQQDAVLYWMETGDLTSIRSIGIDADVVFQFKCFIKETQKFFLPRR